jgi:hypothetical protein
MPWKRSLRLPFTHSPILSTQATNSSRETAAKSRARSSSSEMASSRMILPSDLKAVNEIWIVCRWWQSSSSRLVLGLGVCAGQLACRTYRPSDRQHRGSSARESRPTPRGGVTRRARGSESPKSFARGGTVPAGNWAVEPQQVHPKDARRFDDPQFVE